MKIAEVIIYTDGSSRGNPGPGGWGAIVATHERVVELGGGERLTTNNKMELTSAIEALRVVRDMGTVGTIDMRADSRYVINGITKWIFGWQKNGWRNTQKEEVANRELWEALALVVADVQMSGAKILWNYTPGHSGIPGNERADEIATSYADEKNIKLFDNARETYAIDLSSSRPREGVKKNEKTSEEKARQKTKAYSYLSLVNGKLMRHTTWAECERRVKGVKDTKFKKSVSADDERAIIKSWGLA